MLKKILIGLAVIVLILAVGIYYVISNIDEIAKNIIEESGSEVLGTTVTVGSVEIKLAEGRATVRQLDVANPPGFSDNPAFRFREVTAEIEASTGVVKRLYTSQPEIWVEFKNNKSNFDVLNENIEASAKRARSESKREKEGDKQDKEAVSVNINEVVVEQAKATVTGDQFEEPIELTIKRLEFRDLKGSPQQIARIALGQFVQQVLAATARKMLEQKAETLIEQQGLKLKEKLKELMQ